MRVFLTTFLLVALLPWKTLQAQYLPIPDTNAIWSVWNEKYYPNGDSTINGKQYTAFYLSTEDNITSGSLFAFLRQDTTVGRVYTIPAGDTAEYLLYDFSLEEGDTVTVYSRHGNPNSYRGPSFVTIDFVDSVLYANKYRRRLRVRVSAMSLDFWIEGIGSTLGLFNPGILQYILPEDNPPQLICFEENGQLIYDLPEYPGCYMDYPPGGSVSENSKDIDVSYYPNPVSSVLRIKSSEEMTEVSVYDINGKKLLEVFPKNKDQELDLTGFERGVYLLSVKTSQGRTMKRILKSSME